MMLLPERSVTTLDTVHCMDALTLLRGLPDGYVDAIVTDPPYMGVKDEAWDNQWATPVAYLDWLGLHLEQFKRVLKPNGSLYLFASPQMAARVEVKVGEWFNVLNSLVWRKELNAGKHAQINKEMLRSYFPNTERIIFAERFASDSKYATLEYELNGQVFKPLKEWFRSRAAKFDIGLSQLNAALGSATNGGGLASSYFGDKVEFQLPTKGRYAQMQSSFPLAFDREYEDLRREYEDLRREYEDLRRPFNLTAYDQYTDVWTFRTVQAYDGKHPCEKPLDLLKHIIQTSTRPDAIVLDCFAGSGATLDAARQLGRHFIGCEKDAHWANYARNRVNQLFTLPLFEVNL
jgi:adenine-specific DNA-methyltransferase